MFRTIYAAAITAAFALPASGQERLSFLDLISPERILERVVQTGVMALRTQMDITYGDLAVNPAGGFVTLADLRIWPLPPWEDGGACLISARDLTVRTTPLDETDRFRLKLQLGGASATPECLPPDQRPMLDMLGLQQIVLPRLTIDANYLVGSAQADIHAYGQVAGFASVDLTAEFSYLWMDARDNPDEPVPVAYLSSARLTLENDGGWSSLRPMLPPSFIDPANAPQVLQGMIGAMLTEMNKGAGDAQAQGGADPGQLSPEQRDFMISAIKAWSDFLISPEKLVLETGLEPGADVYLDFESFARDPREVFAALRPRVATAPATAREMLPAALISAALQGSDLAPEERRQVGLALLSGRGAPRDIATGRTLLEPMAAAGDGIAALVLSEVLEPREPEQAYTWALIAGADGQPGATARLNRLEARLPLAEVLRLQEQANANVRHPPSALQQVSLMREQALARLSGDGAVRSYGIAAMWAMLAAAAGDREAADVLDEIDERVRRAGPEARAAWAEIEADASALAMQAWLERDLPARFGTAE